MSQNVSVVVKKPAKQSTRRPANRPINGVAAKSAGTNTSTAKAKPVQLSAFEIERLILDHRENGRKLARSLLRRWRARMSPEEVDSIVDLTLCEAAKRFSPTHGASFMTFMFYHLRGFLVRAVATAMNSNNILLAFQPRSNGDYMDFVSTEDDAMKSFLPECASFGLHEPDGPECALMRKEDINTCRDAVNKLDALEREVLFRSFDREESLVDIARELGYSRCHISRVKKKALERLEEILGIEGLAARACAGDTEIITPRTAGGRPKRRRGRRKHTDSSESVTETTRVAA